MRLQDYKGGLMSKVKKQQDTNFTNIWDSIVKEKLTIVNQETETIYSEDTLHFANQIKSFLMTVDYQTDPQTALQAINLAIKDIYGEEVKFYKVVKTKNRNDNDR